MKKKIILYFICSKASWQTNAGHCNFCMSPLLLPNIYYIKILSYICYIWDFESNVMRLQTYIWQTFYSLFNHEWKKVMIPSIWQISWCYELWFRPEKVKKIICQGYHLSMFCLTDTFKKVNSTHSLALSGGIYPAFHSKPRKSNFLAFGLVVGICFFLQNYLQTEIISTL